MKKILIIGAGFLQSFVIKRAKELGYYTIALDKNPRSVGFEYADEYSVVDIVDQEACLRFARSKNINGVLTAATDYGVLTASYIAKQLGLPGLDYQAAKIIKNKYLVRQTLFNNNIDDISQFYEIDSLEKFDRLMTLVKLPVMVKPCDGSGSKAAKRVDLATELADACKEAIESSLIGKALIEDFIEGKEFGVESFVYNNQVFVLGVMAKYMTNPPVYAELGHSMPSQLNYEEKVREVAINAINALGINFGAVNMDVLVTDDNRVCIVDIGARMGGNLIGSHIIPYATGIDYMGNLIRASVGDSVNLKPQSKKKSVATRLLALTPGKVLKLPNFKKIASENKVEIYHHLDIGKEIREYQNNLDGCGYVVCVADDIQEALNRAEEAKKAIDLSIIRE